MTEEPFGMGKGGVSINVSANGVVSDDYRNFLHSMDLFRTSSDEAEEKMDRKVAPEGDIYDTKKTTVSRNKIYKNSEDTDEDPQEIITHNITLPLVEHIQPKHKQLLGIPAAPIAFLLTSPDYTVFTECVSDLQQNEESRSVDSEGEEKLEQWCTSDPSWMDDPPPYLQSSYPATNQRSDYLSKAALLYQASVMVKVFSHKTWVNMFSDSLPAPNGVTYPMVDLCTAPALFSYELFNPVGKERPDFLFKYSRNNVLIVVVQCSNIPSTFRLNVVITNGVLMGGDSEYAISMMFIVLLSLYCMMALVFFWITIDVKSQLNEGHHYAEKMQSKVDKAFLHMVMACEKRLTKYLFGEDRGDGGSVKMNLRIKGSRERESSKSEEGEPRAQSSYEDSRQTRNRLRAVHRLSLTLQGFDEKKAGDVLLRDRLKEAMPDRFKRCRTHEERAVPMRETHEEVGNGARHPSDSLSSNRNRKSSKRAKRSHSGKPSDDSERESTSSLSSSIRRSPRTQVSYDSFSNLSTLSASCSSSDSHPKNTSITELMKHIALSFTSKFKKIGLSMFRSPSQKQAYDRLMLPLLHRLFIVFIVTKLLYVTLSTINYCRLVYHGTWSSEMEFITFFLRVTSNLLIIGIEVFVSMGWGLAADELPFAKWLMVMVLLLGVFTLDFVGYKCPSTNVFTLALMPPQFTSWCRTLKFILLGAKMCALVFCIAHLQVMAHAVEKKLFTNKKVNFSFGIPTRPDLAPVDINVQCSSQKRQESLDSRRNGSHPSIHSEEEAMSLPSSSGEAHLSDLSDTPFSAHQHRSTQENSLSYSVHLEGETNEENFSPFSPQSDFLDNPSLSGIEAASEKISIREGRGKLNGKGKKRPGAEGKGPKASRRHAAKHNEQHHNESSLILSGYWETHFRPPPQPTLPPLFLESLKVMFSNREALFERQAIAKFEETASKAYNVGVSEHWLQMFVKYKRLGRAFLGILMIPIVFLLCSFLLYDSESFYMVLAFEETEIVATFLVLLIFLSSR